MIDKPLDKLMCVIIFPPKTARRIDDVGGGAIE